jgi:hypothetical protein
LRGTILQVGRLGKVFSQEELTSFLSFFQL